MNDPWKPGDKVIVTDAGKPVEAVMVRIGPGVLWWCESDEWVYESPISEGRMQALHPEVKKQDEPTG